MHYARIDFGEIDLRRPISPKSALRMLHIVVLPGATVTHPTWSHPAGATHERPVSDPPNSADSLAESHDSTRILTTRARHTPLTAILSRNSLDFEPPFTAEAFMSTADDTNSHNREPESTSPSRLQNSKTDTRAKQSGKPGRKQSSQPTSRPPKAPAAVPSAPGTIEDEMGVPIPGAVLAPEAWVSTAIKRLPDGELNFAEVFGRVAPVAIDIGCGNGRFVLSSAVRRPDWDHVAIDILPMVIRYATRRANQRGLSNCRFAACDGSRLLSQYCRPASVDEIHIYHPQPYSDSESQHRRMLTPEFMGLVHRALRPQGKMFLQTDNPAYWEYFRQLVSATMHWHDQLEPWSEDPHGRSRRELLATEKGLSIYRGWAERRDDLSDAELAELIASLPQPTFAVDKASNQTDGKVHKRGGWRSGRRRR